MDFGDISFETKKNERKSTGFSPRKQAFDGIKYAVNEKGHSFRVSNKLWGELDLENHSLMYAAMGDVVIVATVPHGHKKAVLFKENTTAKGDKSRFTKATILEKLMLDAGLINEVSGTDIVAKTPIKQYLDLESIEIDNTPSDIITYKVVQSSELVEETVAEEAVAEEDDSLDNAFTEEAPSEEADLASEFS